MEEEEIFLKRIVSFIRKPSGAEELKIIKYAEERNIHAASNYYRVSRPTIRYWIK